MKVAPVPTDLDPAKVITLLAGFVVSQQVAQIVGPYSLIILAAIGGAGAALGSTTSRNRWNSAVFFGRTVLISLMFTVPMASWLSGYLGRDESQWLFAPTSFVLALLGGKWTDIGGFAVDTAKSWIRAWALKGDKP